MKGKQFRFAFEKYHSGFLTLMELFYLPTPSDFTMFIPVSLCTRNVVLHITCQGTTRPAVPVTPGPNRSLLWSHKKSDCQAGLEGVWWRIHLACMPNLSYKTMKYHIIAFHQDLLQIICTGPFFKIVIPIPRGAVILKLWMHTNAQTFLCNNTLSESRFGLKMVI